MKVHSRKKAYRRMIKDLAKKGMINDVDGKMIKRGNKTSMHRDYHPQTLAEV